LPQRLSAVYFIGSILSEDSFHREFKGRNSDIEGIQPRRKRLFLPARGKLVVKRLSAGGESDYLMKAKPYRVSIDEVLETHRRLPSVEEKEPFSQPKDRHFEIEGEARERAVLLKPALPDLRDLISNADKDIAGDHFNVKVKVTIAPDGRVKAVEKIESCGHPDIDLFAIRYAKKWNFSQLNPDLPQDDQEGILLLKFESK